METRGKVLGTPGAHQLAKWGDKNTKYFHATTVQRRQRNRITMLKINEDTWCREPNAIKQHIRDFYQTLYATGGSRNFKLVLDQCPSPVNDEINAQLMDIVKMEEVEEAVFQLGSLKAPGPDGLNGQFYQHYWEELKHDMFQLVQLFFETGIINPSLNQTHISLIPKVKNPESINQFRPISLCNFSYKIIAKVLANRLKRWLPEIINPEQSAFV